MVSAAQKKAEIEAYIKAKEAEGYIYQEDKNQLVKGKAVKDEYGRTFNPDTIKVKYTAGGLYAKQYKKTLSRSDSGKTIWKTTKSYVLDPYSNKRYMDYSLTRERKAAEARKSKPNKELKRAKERLKNIKKGTTAYELQINRIRKLSGESSLYSVTPTSSQKKQATPSNIKKAQKEVVERQRDIIFRKQAQYALKQKLADQEKKPTISSASLVSTQIKREAAPSSPAGRAFVSSFVKSKKLEASGIEKIERLKLKAQTRINRKTTLEEREKLAATEEKNINREIDKINKNIAKESKLSYNVEYSKAVQERTAKTIKTKKIKQAQRLKSEVLAYNKVRNIYRLKQSPFKVTPEEYFKAGRAASKMGRGINKAQALEYKTLGIGASIVRGVRKQPIKTGAAVLGGVALSLVPEPVTTAGGLSLIGSVVTIGGGAATGLYAGRVASQVYKAPKGTKAQTFGGIVERDAPILVGVPSGYFGVKAVRTGLKARAYSKAVKRTTTLKSFKQDTGYKFTAQTQEKYIPYVKTESGRVLPANKYPSTSSYNTISVKQKPPGFEVPRVLKQSSKRPGQPPQRYLIDSPIKAKSLPQDYQIQIYPKKYDPYTPILTQQAKSNVPQLTYYQKAAADPFQSRLSNFGINKPIDSSTSRLIKVRGGLKRYDTSIQLRLKKVNIKPRLQIESPYKPIKKTFLKMGKRASAGLSQVYETPSALYSGFKSSITNIGGVIAKSPRISAPKLSGGVVKTTLGTRGFIYFGQKQTPQTAQNLNIKPISLSLTNQGIAQSSRLDIGTIQKQQQLTIPITQTTPKIITPQKLTSYIAPASFIMPTFTPLKPFRATPPKVTTPRPPITNVPRIGGGVGSFSKRTYKTNRGKRGYTPGLYNIDINLREVKRGRPKQKKYTGFERRAIFK